MSLRSSERSGLALLLEGYDATLVILDASLASAIVNEGVPDFAYDVGERNDLRRQPNL